MTKLNWEKVARERRERDNTFDRRGRKPLDPNRVIEARFRSRCPRCARWITPGERIHWTKGSPATHLACPKGLDEWRQSKGAPLAE